MIKTLRIRIFEKEIPIRNITENDYAIAVEGMTMR
jgi:hypothetical protein